MVTSGDAPLNTPPPRADAERLRAINRETRSIDRLREHFLVERELAARLAGSSAADRATLYTALYNELFTRVHDHPQNWADPQKRERNTASQLAMLEPYLGDQVVFVELGCGDAAVSKAIAPRIGEAIGVDVTPALMDRVAAPANFRFVQTEGTDLALPDAHADLAYSNQLMEHLHTEDALQQLAEVRRVLKPGGLYLCSTPNRITGPHDISGYFGVEPVGFHLREYDHGSLAAMFRQAGFRSVQARLSVKGRGFTTPVWPVALFERVFSRLPTSIRLRAAQAGPVRSLAGLMLVGHA